MTMIPTGHRAKIPHTLSYPLGAKAISEALEGVPQFDELTVDFRFSNQLARLHGTATPYRVIQAQFSGPLRSFSASTIMHEKTHRFPRWTIRIDAVPRPLRHMIQGKLLVEALPLIRSWLVSNAQPTEREGWQVLSFSFDEL